MGLVHGLQLLRIMPAFKSSFMCPLVIFLSVGLTLYGTDRVGLALYFISIVCSTTSVQPRSAKKLAKTSA